MYSYKNHSFSGTKELSLEASEGGAVWEEILHVELEEARHICGDLTIFGLREPVPLRYLKFNLLAYYQDKGALAFLGVIEDWADWQLYQGDYSLFVH